MASITHRGPSQFQAQIRRKGYPPQQKTFETRREADAWATVIESEMHRGVFVDRSEAEQTTLFQALERYAREVTPTKKSSQSELSLIKRWQAHVLALRPLATLRGADFASYRDERLASVSRNTVRIELALISSVFSTAKKEWSIAVDNPVTAIRKPSPGQARDRRLVGDEEERLLAATDNPRVKSAIGFCIRMAIATGMRAGELLSLEWSQIDLTKKIIRLEKTKNGSTRIVPLSVTAEASVRALPRPIQGGRLTNFHDTNGLDAAFRRLCSRANVQGLRFHDLRHEAASRFAPNMEVITLAKIMGWKTLQMAMRYYNPSCEELVTAVRPAA